MAIVLGGLSCSESSDVLVLSTSPVSVFPERIGDLLLCAGTRSQRRAFSATRVIAPATF